MKLTAKLATIVFLTMQNSLYIKSKPSKQANFNLNKTAIDINFSGHKDAWTLKVIFISVTGFIFMTDKSLYEPVREISNNVAF